MLGYAGKMLRINLTTGQHTIENLPEKMVLDYIGGRGFAAKILWDEAIRVAPFSEDNRVILATGPLTALPIPGSGKMVIATKSPLTGGYCDGNIGTRAAIKMKKAGYDLVIIQGKAQRPCYLNIKNNNIEILDAEEIWGKNTFDAQELLEQRHGKKSGILLIGPAGENLIPYAVVMSQKGRAGGRPGIGAVLGWKNIKAIVFNGNKRPKVFDDKKLKSLNRDANKIILNSPDYNEWLQQGTMSGIKWADGLECLPVNNFSKGVFSKSKECDGDALVKAKIGRKGCPQCTMQCGMIIEDASQKPVEVDYENVAMLGPNIGISNLDKIGALNRLADEYGMDTISLGNNIAFLMEASEKGLIDTELRWGDYRAATELVHEIAHRKGLGKLASEGVLKASQNIGCGSTKWAMHIKGLEISAYNCFAFPTMALCLGTSPIGGHHKDGLTMDWEKKYPAKAYEKEAAEEVIAQQRIRSGFFETATICRFQVSQGGLELAIYLKFFETIFGRRVTRDHIMQTGDRIFNLIRCFWIREYDHWDRRLDYPPMLWFHDYLPDDSDRKRNLVANKYDQLLSTYYSLRGWNYRGIPEKETLDSLGLGCCFIAIDKKD